MINPATEAPFARVIRGSAEDIDRAVLAARKAFASFSTSSTASRIELIEQIVRKLEAREDEIMAAITQPAARSWSSPVSSRLSARSC